MNPQQALKPSSSLDIHTIDMDTQEKTFRHHRKQSMPHSKQRPATTRRLTPIQRIILSVSACLLILFGLALTASPQNVRRMGCHQQQVVEEIAEVESPSFSSWLNAASPEALRGLLHKSFPEWFQPEAASDRHAMEAIHRADTPLATTILTLARRADNSTTSTTSTQTTASNPPDTTSSKSTTSSSTPSSTTPPVTTTSSKSTTPGTSTSPSVMTQVPSTSSTSESSSTSKSSSSTSQESLSATSSTSGSLPPSSIDGGTTLTTSTTLDPTTTSYSTSKLTTETFTSTSNGEVIIVTATSYVGVDPVETSAQTTTKPPPSLQNNAVRQGYSGQLFAVVMGMVMGIILL